MKSSVHLHVNVGFESLLRSGMHKPPFKHGIDLHGSMSPRLPADNVNNYKINSNPCESNEYGFKIYTIQIITKLFALSVIVAVLTAYVTGESRLTDTLV
jgi:hypothetical protein